MGLTEMTIQIPKEYEEEILGILYLNGVQGVEIEDYSDLDIIKKDLESWSVLDENEFIYDGNIKIKAYFDDGEGKIPIEAIRNRLKNYKEAKIIIDDINEEDWTENWKQYYHPIEVGEKVLIVPEWEEIDKSCKRQILRIDPGMAFGTGTHETTRLSIEALEKVIEPNMKVLDIGTGSGILAIASILLGAGEAMGIDIDSMAVKNAKENVRLNNLEDKIEIKKGDLLDSVDEQYDLLVSNIVCEILLRMMEDIKKVLRPNGIFISSGIIDSKEDEMRDGLIRHGFKIIERLEEKNWVAFIAKEDFNG